MKKLLMYILFINIYFTENPFAQNLKVTEIGKPVRFGNNSGELGKNLQFESGDPRDFFPDDIAIDIYNNIYVCDTFSKTIIKYDSLFNFIHEIKVEDENFSGKLVPGFEGGRLIPLELHYHINLETDIQGNLYCLITYRNSFYRLIKYNPSGALFSDFELNVLPASTVGISFFQITTNKIFITTRIEYTLDKSFDDYMKQNVFIYDTDGKFLGRSDLYFEDFNGAIYKQSTTLDKRNKLWIDQYNSDFEGKIRKTNELNINKSLYAELPDNVSLGLIGVDKSNNLFFGRFDPFIIRIFNFNENMIKATFYQSLRKKIREDYNMIVPTLQSLRVSLNGDLFIYGIKILNDKHSTYSSCNYTDLGLSILKVKY